MSESDYAELARLGTATVYEGGGRRGLIDAPLHQVVPGTRVAGPARIARCAQDDNLMVHAAMAALQPGEVLVLSMPEPAPVALVGDLLATQAKVHGAAGDPGRRVGARPRGAGRARAADLGALRARARAQKQTAGELDVPVEVGGATIRPGDVVVLDADGAAVVEHERVAEVLEGALEREDNERVKRAKLQGGALSYDLDGLREIVEEAATRDSHLATTISPTSATPSC